MPCSAIKARGRTKKMGHLELWCFSSEVTITHDGALLSWKNTCLPMGSRE